MTQANPLPAEISAQLSTLSPTQLAWLSGYCWAQSQGNAAANISAAFAAEATAPAAARRVTVLSASQTGNARRVAETLHGKLEEAGITARLAGAADFKSKTLPDEDIVLLVTSTQGEGEPPEEALPLYKFLFGKKAPDLSKLTFAVLGLGDSSYPKFCQAGKDFDEKLAALGASRLHDVGICDLEYQTAADAWIDAIVPKVTGLAAQSSPASAQSVAAQATAAAVYTKEQPLTASLSVRQKITSRNAEKDVEHIEIDLSGSGLQYQAGDALGIWPLNAPELVKEILELNQLSGSEPITLPNGNETDIQTALSEFADITQITPAFVQQYAELSGSADLQSIAGNAETLDTFLAATPPVGVLAQYPHILDAQTLFGLFRPQTPRLYSIASAQDEVGEEVHLTVGVVRFEHHSNTYTGAASGFLGSRLEEGDSVRVFVEPNPHFRLPQNGSTPIIMIGAGTGIAPFRSFMQQRAANGDEGKNWLIFGNQRFTDDFLYQTEWQQFRKDGLLTRADLAWSRQGAEKVYVQHKITANAAEVWAWLQQGAHLYVCGDAGRMARDVEEALLAVIAEQGGLSRDEAEDYLNDLREDKRYQRDVY
ncbi:assimilatory sulfite reductase (NADPH) flavoprotein subunit [Neisseria animalis]|uniref:Sulfite reductase [NADPH] flavoprotein alpha-component n=1 Tax=Neisseria animalis TaxID=492 RepID=A0A5P3MP91_NEIAN|nr:assimilatory sulfite reductase (NADPH) flavoprotein subunit [Neisseria animalis]QEY23230.1 assimilatory sulfite reductase (NADPH) flavoprotein subunit [Neisseria animalis]ROW31814.1 assimilatory sulfite reductase (NADPH) flavoprotein subunit [Neisseria animalis]VEE08441.1 sulfite reductase flavoprotein, alpha-component [Neisseria animalis]